MKVWIDQDLCTGDGLCEEIAPDVFVLLDDGLAYVKEGDKVFGAGPEGLANVPDDQVEACIESAEECPGECIFLEADQFNQGIQLVELLKSGSFSNIFSTSEDWTA